MKAIYNINHCKKCAFCQYWYDPASSNIAPKVPRQGVWEVLDVNKKAMCVKGNLQVPAHFSCPQYECKL